MTLLSALMYSNQNSVSMSHDTSCCSFDWVFDDLVIAACSLNDALLMGNHHHQNAHDSGGDLAQRTKFVSISPASRAFGGKNVKIPGQSCMAHVPVIFCSCCLMSALGGCSSYSCFVAET